MMCKLIYAAYVNLNTPHLYMDKDNNPVNIDYI